MKKRICIAIGLTAFIMASLPGCQKAAPAPESAPTETAPETPAPEPEKVEAPAAAAEEHTMTTDIEGCDTFTQIVDKLEEGKGYANATIDGTDVLLVASGTYDDLEGHQAAIDAEVFGYNADGAIEYLGYAESGGTAYPLMIKDGKLISGGNHYMTKSGVEGGKLVIAESAGVIYDAGGNETYYCGPDSNTDDQDKAKALYESLIDEMGEGEVIDFQPVGGAFEANTWRDITEEDACELISGMFKMPEGAENVKWTALSGETPEDYYLVQAEFDLKVGETTMSFTARAKAVGDNDENVSEVERDWTVSDEGKLSNWGGGEMAVTTYRYLGEKEAVDLARWFDIETGVSYSLCTIADNADALDGFDIQAIVEDMYNENNVFGANAPSDFLQEQSGIREFSSYDEVIAQLKPGQGYAYINLKGYDGDLLAVTELVFEADNTASEAAIYAKTEDGVKNVGNVISNGSAYPLRCEDGVIYAGDMHTYESSFISPEFGGIMVKDYVSDGLNYGPEEYSGFLRESNDYDHDKEFTGGKEEFTKMLDEREKKKVIEFTAIK